MYKPECFCLIRTIKIIVSFFFCLTFSTLNQGFCQTDSISVQPIFKKGEKFVLQIKETSRQFLEKELIAENESEYGIKITVLEASSDGYLLKYDLRDFLFFDDDPDMVDKINHLDKGLVLELELDELAAFKGIKNWKNLRDQAYKMLDDIRITIGYNPDLVANFDTLKNVFSNRSRLEDHFAEEAQIWTLANGLYFEKGEVFKTDALLPVLLSNDSIPAEVSLGLKKIYNKTADVFYLQTFEQNDVKDLMEDELSFMTGIDLNILNGINSRKFFMQYDSELKINTDTHLCDFFTYRTVTKIGPIKVIDRINGELKRIR